MKKPLIKFHPNKRTIRDGGPRPRSNGDNAADGAEIISLVRDHDQLGDHERLTDTLTNLMHWADREQVDFDLALSSASHHHEMEY